MILIHGSKNQGKTTQVKQITQLLLNNNKSVMGFYSEKIMSDKKVIGYNLITIPQNKIFPFLSIVKNENQQQIGAFFIDDVAIKNGRKQIEKAITTQVDFVIIDEVGKLELNNKGWHICIEKLLSEFNGKIILSIRTEFIEKAIKKWDLKNIKLISVHDDLNKINYF